MDVILLNLPWRKGERVGVRAGSRWPFTSLPGVDGKIDYVPFPFFLAYATSLLKKNRFTARLIDAVAEGVEIDDLIKRLRGLRSPLLVVETSTPSFPEDIMMLRRLSGSLDNPKIVLCGPHAGYFCRQIMKENDLIDFILIGEYECSLLELAARLQNGGSADKLKGVVYREGESVVVNTGRPAIGNLDDLPWPDREDVPIYAYKDAFCGLPLPNVQMLASRGCPFHCSFCLWPQVMYGQRRYRKRGHADVADEMDWLIRKFGFKSVYFDDDTFNVERKQVLLVCDEIKRRGVNVPWAVMGRSDILDPDTLRKMRDAGLYAIKYGIESADERVLRLCGKRLDLRRSAENIRVSKSLGIRVHLTFCLGLPGETQGSISKTLNFIEQTRPDSLQVSFAVPFPGTEYYRYALKRGLEMSKDLSDYDGNNDRSTVMREMPWAVLLDARREMMDLARNSDRRN